MVQRGRPRLDDVAAAAGVSRMTVSRVLGHPETVAPATRARVHEAIASLGYVPDLAARDLAVGTSGIVGVMVPNLDNQFFARTARGVAKGLDPHGMQILIGDSNFSPERERKVARALLSRRPAAIVLMGTDHSDDMRSMLAGSGVRIIETWDLTSDPIDICIGFSSEKAGEAVGAHLAATGRRNIVALGLDLPRNTARLRGAVRAARAAGASCDTILTTERPHGMFHCGRMLFREAMARRPRPDGLFFVSDTYALGAMLEAQRMGIRIPDDVAIAGFNNHDLSSQWDPGLTSVIVPDSAMGEAAAARILGGHDDAPAVVDLGFELVVRASTRG